MDGWVVSYLAVGGAVGLDGPAGLVAERLEHLVVVAVLGEVVVAVGPESGEDLGGDRAAPALPAAVVLALPPRGHPGAPDPGGGSPGAARHRRPRAPDLADLPCRGCTHTHTRGSLLAFACFDLFII